MAFQTLLPRTAYESSDSYWHRLRWWAGLLFGVPMTTFMVLRQRDGLFVNLILGVAGSVAFGFLTAWWARRASRTAIDRAYLGDPTVVADPPNEAEYPSRLPCGYQLSTRRMVPGVLYVGCTNLLFMPNRAARRLLRDNVALGALLALEFSRSPWQLGFLARQVAPDHRTLIRVEGAGAVTHLEVPDPAGFLRAIEICKAACRGNGA
jgi:hypothetical protein